MTYLPALAALAAAMLIGWIGDQVSGRRGFVATGMVSTTGALCGWFLTQRVFSLGGLGAWDWAPWSVLGAILALTVFLLFRRKR